MPWQRDSGRRKKRRVLHNQDLHKKRAIPERLRIILMIAAGLVILVLLVLLLRPQTQLLSSPEVNMLRRRGVIRIGVTENVPGLGNDGSGLEADLARALAALIFEQKDADSSLLLVPVTKNTAMPKLNDSEVDLLLCQCAYTAGNSYACSAPYYQDPIRLLCQPSQSHMALASAKIAVLQGSPVIAALSSHFSEDAVPPELITYAAYPDMLEALVKQSVSFAAMPQSIAARYLEQPSEEQLLPEGYVYHQEEVGSLSYVAICSSDSPAIIELFDHMVSEYKESGAMQTLLLNNGLQTEP